MATRAPVDEKFEKTEFDLFEALSALDKKDYGYYDRLTAEQQKKFAPFMMLHWMSAVKGSGNVQDYYLRSVDYHANRYLFNESVQKQPKLQWLMLCAASPGIGKQFHQWIPLIRDKVAKYKEAAKTKEIKDYYTKVYPKVDGETLKEITETYIVEQKRKMVLSAMFPNMKLQDIEVLHQLVSDEDIDQYEKDLGN